ncbi:MAG: DsbA family protein [Nanoarchaeota archaeon]|nr:DsbA family protein [Nanoarchaeota archaeon]
MSENQEPERYERPSSEAPRTAHPESISMVKLFIVVLLAVIVGTYAVNIVMFQTSGLFVADQGATQQPVAPTAPNEPEAPVRVQASIDDDAVLGSPNAPVTIIEFSDFQCPYCEKFFTETHELIKEQYIDTGKVKLVFRDFPLSFHPNAHMAAEAAECAKDQGGDEAYWAYHDTIFGNQALLSPDIYETWAADLGLDVETFKTCLESGAMASEVDKDFADGASYGIQGTPSFLIGNDQDGYVGVVGAQPFAVFKSIIDAELA